MTRRRSTPSTTEAPASLWLYIAFVVLVGVGLLWLAYRVAPLQHDLLMLVVLCALGIMGSAWRDEVVAKVPLSFTFIVLLASVALIGPLGAAIVGAFSDLSDIVKRYPVKNIVFNTAMTSIVGAVGGFAYLLAGGAQLVDTVDGMSGLMLHVGLPIMVADVAQCLCNALLLSGVMRLWRGVPVRRFFLGMLGSSGPAYIGYGIIGYLFVILWIPAGVGPFSALLVLAPLFVARWAFVQYGDEQRAHERTLRALVAAVETKDPFTRGHSERIANLCDLMAGALALGQRRTEALRYAGMLHDIGKLGVPSRLLHKASPLNEAELAAVAMHPVRGADMIRGIDFLQESVDGILHHHERFDGRGYPHGLAGSEIPEFARIIAVADAFDSLTLARLGRPGASTEEALADLRARSGTHLDPAMVAALERALARHEWQPAAEVESSSWGQLDGAYDHDDPRESDRLAARVDVVRLTPEHPRTSEAKA